MNSYFILKQGDLSPEQIEEAASTIWTEFLGSPELQQKMALENNSDGPNLDNLFQTDAPPYKVRPSEEGLDPVSQFVIVSIAGGITYDAAKYVFLNWVLPRIRTLYGDSAVGDEAPRDQLHSDNDD